MKIELIAEIAQAHDGSLGIAHSMIDAIAATGVDTIKFQVHIAEAESSELEPFRVPFSFADKTRFDYWNRTAFSKEEWLELKRHCEHCNVNFLASPFSIMAVEWLEAIEAERYKVASGEIANQLLLKTIAEKNKPVIISTGLGNDADITKALEIFSPFGVPLTLLQCSTIYPCPPEEWHFSRMLALKNKFNTAVGYSDHSGDITSAIAAAALGAEVIEFHACFDKRMFGPDSAASLTMQEISSLVKSVRKLEHALGSKATAHTTSDDKQLKTIFGKTLAANRTIAKGEMITRDMLETKKPAGQGIAAAEWESVIGRITSREISKWSFISNDDLL